MKIPQKATPCMNHVETGATVSCAFGAEHAILTAEDGSQALIEGDDDIQQVVSTAQDGSQLVFDYQGVVEGSAEEDDLDGILTLTMLGQAELSEDQMAALAATTAAAEEVIGSADMGWGWAKKFVKNVVKTVKAVLCHDAMKVICNVAGTGGQAVVTICAKAGCPPEATVAAGVIAAVGKACTSVQTVVCD